MNKIIQASIVLLAFAVTSFILWIITVSKGQVTDYPLNLELRGDVKVENGVATLTHQVTFDESEQLFVYHYKISYTGPVVLFKWEILDAVAPSNLSFLELTPNCKYEYSIKSKSPPVMYRGQIDVLQKTTPDFDYLKCENGGVWQLATPVFHVGPVPLGCIGG